MRGWRATTPRTIRRGCAPRGARSVLTERIRRQPRSPHSRMLVGRSWTLESSGDETRSVLLRQCYFVCAVLGAISLHLAQTSTT
jgi:hypothetical protein